MTEPQEQPPVEAFKALADPVRWAILERASGVDQVACQELDNLPVSKPTISYHLKILSQAGLISVRKAGRNTYYSLEREALHQVLDALWSLAPTPRPMVSGEPAYVNPRRRQLRAAAEGVRGMPVRRHEPQRGDEEEAVVLTW
jgi:DNA-binding transcriptional ArsR family regulator